MRTAFLTLFIVWLACNTKVQPPPVEVNQNPVKTDTVPKTPPPPEDTLVTTPAYGNAIFRNVKVTATDDHTFLVSGKARVFEATFSWVLQNAGKEIKSGHLMTDAGAPAWGNFSFSIDTPKKNPGNKLTLVLFEASAKDGSRQNQLPIVLNDK